LDKCADFWLLELCNLCYQNRAILPSLEAFEMGIEIPCIYFLFYEYFFKSSVGDVRWRKACVEETDQSAPLGSVQAEAFAMLQLKNNYFAWLLEAKEKLQLLVTDYDPDSKRAGMKSAPEVYLKKLQLNVTGDGDMEDLLVAEGDTKYNDLKKSANDLLVRARCMAKNNATYKEVKKTVESLLNAGSKDTDGEGGEDYDAENDDEKKRERQRKRRKVLKPFREYTVRQGEEGKFKGWSKRAASDMAALCKKLKQERNECVKFRVAYRKIYLSRNQERRNAKKDEEERVDYDELWDLGEINVTEI
jgi:hypothetical protein